MIYQTNDSEVNLDFSIILVSAFFQSKQNDLWKVIREFSNNFKQDLIKIFGYLFSGLQSLLV